VNYVSTTVLKQRAQFEQKRETEAAVGRILVCLVAVCGLVMCSWMFR